MDSVNGNVIRFGRIWLQTGEFDHDRRVARSVKLLLVVEKLGFLLMDGIQVLGCNFGEIGIFNLRVLTTGLRAFPIRIICVLTALHRVVFSICLDLLRLLHFNSNYQ